MLPYEREYFEYGIDYELILTRCESFLIMKVGWIFEEYHEEGKDEIVSIKKPELLWFW